MQHLVRLLTHDWLNKVLALGLAVIIFLVVDGKIMTDETVPFTIEFGQVRPNTGGNTIFLTLEPGYTATLEGLEPAAPENPLEGNKIQVKFTGPNQIISDITGEKKRGSLVGSLDHKLAIQDPKLDEQTRDIPGTQIRFHGINTGKITIEKIPNLHVRILRVITQPVNVTPDRSWYRPRTGYQLGEPVPDRPTVNVTCPKLYFNFSSVRLVPGDRISGNPKSRKLSEEVNQRSFKVERPRDIPPWVPFSADPAEMEVTLRLVPLNDKLDIEVLIVLKIPPDGSLSPTPAKTRETFTFIGPPTLLKRCKEAEGTDSEIQAVLNLTRLSNERIKKLKEDGIPLAPEFDYPFEEARRLIRCEQAKSIWLTGKKTPDKE